MPQKRPLLLALGLLCCGLVGTGCSGFVNGVRDYYTKPAGQAAAASASTRQDHYDSHGNFVGWTRTGPDGRQTHYDAHGNEVATSRPVPSRK